MMSIGWRIRKMKLNKPVLFLASIVLPGLAHIMLKHWLKAAIIVASYIFHLIFILTIYNHQVLQIPLTIVTLLVAICAHYFYSVFNALQLFEFETLNKKTSSGLKLAGAGIVILCWGILVALSYYNASISSLTAYYYPYTFLMFTIVYLLMHLTSWQWRAIYIGRISVIVCLTVFCIIGFTFEQLWQQLHINMLVLTVVVLFLLEGSIFYLLKKLNKLRSYNLRVDLVGWCVVIVFTSIFMLVPKFGHLPSELLKSFHTNNHFVYDYESHKPIKRVAQPISVAIDEQQQQNALSIQHRNGLVKLQGYKGDYIKIEYASYEVNDQEFQRTIEETNHVQVDVSDGHMKIGTVLAQDEQRISKMDIVISIPYHLKIGELDIKLEHGTLQLDRVKQFNLLHINGEEVNVNLMQTSGNVNIQLKNGDSYVFQHSGPATIKTRSGHIMLHQILQEISAETLKGNILIMMKTLNESIYAHASIGSVHIDIPNMVTYNFNANSSFGTIKVNDITYYKNVTFNTPITKKQIEVYADQDIVID